MVEALQWFAVTANAISENCTLNMLDPRGKEEALFDTTWKLVLYHLICSNNLTDVFLSIFEDIVTNPSYTFVKMVVQFLILQNAVRILLSFFLTQYASEQFYPWHHYN